jgi:hypothetical protein
MSSPYRNDVSQTLAYGASATVANPFGPQTYQIRISATSDCYYKIVPAAGGTATASDVLLPFRWVEVIHVSPGQKIAAIQAPTNGLVTGTAGTLSVTELTK